MSLEKLKELSKGESTEPAADSLGLGLKWQKNTNEDWRRLEIDNARLTQLQLESIAAPESARETDDLLLDGLTSHDKKDPFDLLWEPLKKTDIYKRYQYSQEDVLKEVKTISIETGIPETAMLASPESLKKAREIKAYRDKQMKLAAAGIEEYDNEAMYKAYPELKKLSATDSAIALSNIENVLVSRNIMENGYRGWERGSLGIKLNELGAKKMNNGGKLSEAEDKELSDIRKKIRESGEIVSVFDDPIAGIVGSTAEQLPRLIKDFTVSQLYGAAAAGIVGTGTIVLTKNPTMSMTAAQRAYSWGVRAGMPTSMFKDMAGGYYLEFSDMKGMDGKQLLTHDETLAAAAVVGAINTGVEFYNMDKLLSIVSGGKQAAIKEIIANYKNHPAFIQGLKQYAVNAAKRSGEALAPELVEEGIQDVVEKIAHNYMISGARVNDYKRYTNEEIAFSGVQAMGEAVPATLGLGAILNVGGMHSGIRNIAEHMRIKQSEQMQSNHRTNSMSSMLNDLSQSKEVSELYQKDPEIAKTIVQEQLPEEFKETRIDTEMAIQEEKGMEFLYQVANNIGMTPEQLQETIDNKAELVVPSSVYLQTKIENSELATNMDNHICPTPNDYATSRRKFYAKEAARYAETLTNKEAKRQAEAVEILLDNTFEEHDNRKDLAREIIYANPENPAQGWKNAVYENEAAIAAIFNGLPDKMEQDGGQGVAIVVDPERDGRGTRQSNNPAWYRSLYSRLGRTPTKQDYKNYAYEVLTDPDAASQFYGMDVLSGTEDDRNQVLAALGENKKTLDQLFSRAKVLKSVKDNMLSMTAGEVKTLSGLSKEGYSVYRSIVHTLAASDNEKVSMAARVGAILFAHHADRMADVISKSGKKDYTAMQYMQEFLGRIDPNAKTISSEDLNQYDTTNTEFERQKQAIKEKYQNTDMYLKAPNGKPSNLTEDQWLTVRTNTFKRWFGNWDLDENIEIKTTDLNKVVTEINDEMFIDNINLKDTKELRNWLKKELVGKSVKVDDDGLLVGFNSRKLGDSLKRRNTTNNQQQRSAYSALEEIIKNAVLYDFVKTDGKTKHDNIYGQDVYYSAFTYRGDQFYVKVKLDIEKNSMNAIYKDHRVKEIKIEPITNYTDHLGATPKVTYTYLGSISMSSILEADNIVKPEFSKVVDENGEPLVMYHGTNATFESFSNDRNIHFVTPSDKWARDFAHSDYAKNHQSLVLPLYIKAANPFDFENKGHVKKLAIAASLGSLAVSQIKKGVWSRIEDGTTLQAIKSLGFDGVYVKENGVKNLAVFSSEQIKSLDNRGTFNNNDTNIYNQFAGARSQNANLSDLAKAKSLDAGGFNSSEILKTTGWFKGNDGKWRYEISDVKADIKPNWQDNAKTINSELRSLYLSDLLDHEQLYAAYPQLANLKVIVGNFSKESDTLGQVSYSEDYPVMYIRDVPKTNKEAQIAIENEIKKVKKTIKGLEKTLADQNELQALKEMLGVDQDGWQKKLAEQKTNLKQLNEQAKNPAPKDVLLHEIQHVIQWFEKFAVGGNSAAMPKIKKALENKLDYVQNSSEYKSYKEKLDNALSKLMDDLITDEEFDAILEQSKKENSYLNYYYRLEKSISNFIDDNYYDYKNLAGEIEARATSERQNLSKEERLNSLPESNSDAIVVFRGREYSSESISMYYQQTQGAIGFDQGKAIIKLFEGADQSTFLHEMGHLFLRDLKMFAEVEGAPAQIKTDWETVARWIGSNDDGKAYADLTDEELQKELKTYNVVWQQDMSREKVLDILAHEKFARGFEAYLRSGQAPKYGLKAVFRQLKSWLSKIYKNFLELGGLPNAEIRAVMGRMIATQEEIDTAAALANWDSFKAKGGTTFLDEKTSLLYDKWNKKAREEACEEALKLAMQEVKRLSKEEKQAAIEAERKSYREALTQENIFAAEALVRFTKNINSVEAFGYTVDEYKAELESRGGSLETALDTHMQEFISNLGDSPMDETMIRSKAKEIVRSSRYQELIAALEYKALQRLNADANTKAKKLVNKIENHLFGKDNTRVKRADKKSDDLKNMLRDLRYAYRWNGKELALIEAFRENIAKHEVDKARGKIKEIKERIAYSKKQVRILRDEAIGTNEQYKELARKKLSSMSIGQASGYKHWIRRATQKGQDAIKALSLEDYDAMVKAKQEQLLYSAMATESERIHKETTKILKILNRQNDSITKGTVKLPLAERYYFKDRLHKLGIVNTPVSKPYSKIPTLHELFGEYAESFEVNMDSFADGIALAEADVSGEFYTSAGNKLLSYNSMTLSELRSFNDTMQKLYFIGKDKHSFKSIKDKNGNTISIDEAVTEIIAEISNNVIRYRENTDSTGMSNKPEKHIISDAFREGNYDATKIETILDTIGEVAHRYIYEPINNACNKSLLMQEVAINDTKSAFGLYSTKELYSMYNDEKYQVGTSKLTKENLLMLALNWGTTINKKRVMDGYMVSEQEVLEALSNLDARDWKFVQQIWDAVGKYWEETNQIEEEMSGVGIGKEHPVSFSITDKRGNVHHVKGGYFRIVFDPTKDTTVAGQSHNEAVKSQMLGNQVFGTGRGHLKDRNKSSTINKKLWLDFSIIAPILDDAIHNIAYRKAIRDVNRVVTNKSFNKAFVEYFGDAAYKTLDTWVKNNWKPETRKHNLAERILNWALRRQAFVVLGFRSTTAILNLANIAPALNYMRKMDNSTLVLKEFFDIRSNIFNGVDSYKFAREKSAFMRDKGKVNDSTIKETMQHAKPSIIPGKDAMESAAFKLIAMTDELISIPLWNAVYKHTIAQEQSKLGKESTVMDAEHLEYLAINAADKAVRQVFGSNDIKDQAAIQRSSSFIRLFNPFYSYFNVMYNAVAADIHKVSNTKDGEGKLKAVVNAGITMFFWFVLTAAIEESIRYLISSDDEKRKDKRKPWQRLAQGSLNNAAGTIPIVRDVFQVTLRKIFEGGWTGTNVMRPSIATDALDRFGVAGDTAGKILSGSRNKKDWIDFGRELNRSLNIFLKTPDTITDAVWTTARWMQTDFNAKFAEYLRAVIFDQKLK